MLYVLVVLGKSTSIAMVLRAELLHSQFPVFFFDKFLPRQRVMIAVAF